MKLLKSLLSTPNSESRSREVTPMDLPNLVNIEPLWTSFAETKATVTRLIAPDTLGRVKFQGTSWRAWSDRPFTLEPGTVVRVIGRQRSNILVVEPSELAVPVMVP